MRGFACSRTEAPAQTPAIPMPGIAPFAGAHTDPTTPGAKRTPYEGPDTL